MADKHEAFRTRMCTLLDRHESFELISEVEGDKELLLEIEKRLPDIIFIDHDLITESEDDILYGIKKINGNIKIIVLSLYADPAIVHDSIEKGSFGFMLKKTSYQEVLQAIDTVSQGNVFLCKETAKILF
ncbi:MAG: response regulator [Bacteroidota bacterium]|nr:response regulator [Bacteroidota bacterium]